MSSERSDLWLSTQERLSLKENRVKEELDQASDKLEKTIKTVATFSLVAGAVFFVSYKVYQRTSGKKTEKAKKKLKEKAREVNAAIAPRPGFKQILMERVALMLVQVIGTQFGVYLSRKLEDDQEKEVED